jgi:hypothetical protein
MYVPDMVATNHAHTGISKPDFYTTIHPADTGTRGNAFSSMQTCGNN